MRLTCSSLSKAYGNRIVLSHISVQFPVRGLCVLTGTSGVGKTTLLRLLAGLEKPDAGNITIPEQPAVCFQEYRLFAHLTALENLTALLCRRNQADQIQACREILYRLELDDQAQRSYPHELSGGMKQRVSLARALCSSSGILLLDEPLKELDEKLRRAAMELILERSRASLVIMTAHEWTQDIPAHIYNVASLNN